MTSSTDIANMALSQVPAGSITSLNETSLQAKYCKLWYAQVQAELLEKGPWRFNIVRVALAEAVGNDRQTRWAWAYEKPPGLAVILQLVDASGCVSQDYEFAGDYLYTNLELAQVDYISHTIDPLAKSATALFKAALIATLAARIAPSISKDLKRIQLLSNAAEVAVERAQAANHNERGNTYGDHIPDILRERMGLPLVAVNGAAPEAVFPEFDPVQLYEDET